MPVPLSPTSIIEVSGKTSISQGALFEPTLVEIVVHVDPKSVEREKLVPFIIYKVSGCEGSWVIGIPKKEKDNPSAVIVQEAPEFVVLTTLSVLASIPTTIVDGL